MILRRYAVTVMDGWTPMRYFFTLRGALRWRLKYRPSYIWKWEDGQWRAVTAYDILSVEPG